MKKIAVFLLGLSISGISVCASQKDLHFTYYKKNDPNSPKIISEQTLGKKSLNDPDPPNYVSGAFNFYNADRDPTSDEPDILSGLLVPQQILQWKNTNNSNLWYLVSATGQNPDGSPVLVWAEIYSSGSLVSKK